MPLPACPAESRHDSSCTCTALHCTCTWAPPWIVESCCCSLHLLMMGWEQWCRYKDACGLFAFAFGMSSVRIRRSFSALPDGVVAVVFSIISFLRRRGLSPDFQRRGDGSVVRIVWLPASASSQGRQFCVAVCLLMIWILSSWSDCLHASIHPNRWYLVHDEYTDRQTDRGDSIPPPDLWILIFFSFFQCSFCFLPVPTDLTALPKWKKIRGLPLLTSPKGRKKTAF